MISNKGFLVQIYLIEYFLVSVSSNICVPNPCKNSGDCKVTNDGHYNCVCMYGWKGSNCEENLNDCINNPCKNGGICVDQPNGRYWCNCSNSYIGDNCQYFNRCAIGNPCKNGGQCKQLANDEPHCKCLDGFIGKTCESKAVKCPDNINETRELCNNNGICQLEQNNAFYCKCDAGYTGTYCDQKSNSGIDMGCKNGYCKNGDCITEKSGSPRCKCFEGYSGSQCHKKNKFIKDRNESNFYSTLDRNLNGTGVTSKYSISKSNCDLECQILIGNGVCDKRCNTSRCRYDGGDCDPWRKCMSGEQEECRSVFNNGICNPECNSVDCLFDGKDCQRITCQNIRCTEVYQNNICDEKCNTPQCGFDGGDCHIKSSNSFFSSESLIQCAGEAKIFELDLILMTSINNFTKQKMEFLQKLSSSLRMVVRIADLKEIEFHYAKALQITLYVNHTQCILHGGQCFSSLDQISNFIKAGIQRGNVLSLPFAVAKVDTHIWKKPIRSVISSFVMILGAMGLGLMICFVLLGVLLRDKWGKLRTKIKTTGVWTPSDGYSTSTSSINSGHKPGWQALPQMKDFKKECQMKSKNIYGENNLKIAQDKNMNVETDHEKICVNYNRKRKYEMVDRDDKALSFRLITEVLESSDGVHPNDSGLADVHDIVTCKQEPTNDEKYQSISLEGLGDYVNENGESLMHIAARMNCGPNLIKQLNSLSSSMLLSLDEWGRTPLATAVAADAAESVEQLLILEKQLRKEFKQNKSRSGLCSINSGVSCEYLVKKTTALIESVKLDSKDLINLLLDEGNPINVLDTQGRSVVHWASMFNNYSLLERLSHMKIFQKLADLKDYEDKSPLYMAANEGAFEAVKFLLDYFNKNGIQIDPNCPCPKMVADEKGFHEIRDLINETLRKVTILDKNGKRIKLKESKKRNKIPNFDNLSSNLCIIDEYKELSCNSVENFQNSPIENESIDSCLLELYSITDSSQQKPQNLNLCSSFKPMECRYQGYQSNTSSSDMSPPLLNLNNPHFQNGFNPITYSDPIDPNLSNTIFMSPKSYITQPDSAINTINKNKVIDPTSELYNFRSSPTLSDYKHRSINHSSFPSLNCLL